MKGKIVLKTKGNKSRQNKRRRQRKKNLPPRQSEPFELIDGNLTHYPIGYCKHHGAWLSLGLTETHRCKPRQCSGYVEGVDI